MKKTNILFKKALPSVYVICLVHVMITNEAFTLGLNTLTSMILLANIIATYILSILGNMIDNVIK